MVENQRRSRDIYIERERYRDRNNRDEIHQRNSTDERPTRQ